MSGLEARTYLRNNDKGRSNGKSECRSNGKSKGRSRSFDCGARDEAATASALDDNFGVG
jgi:hypothetical protein